jgi:hypothetical protein
MARQRLTSWTTIWFAWILPIIFLPIWSFVILLLIYSYFEPAGTLFIFFSTLILWILYLTTKPWQLKYVYKGDNGFIFHVKGQEQKILFTQVKNIYASFFSKYSPIIIEYIDNATINKIAFIPRQSKVILLFPFFRHPMTKELIEEVKTGANRVDGSTRIN